MQVGTNSRYAASTIQESFTDDNVSIFPHRTWADQAVEAHEFEREHSHDVSASPKMLGPTSTPNQKIQNAIGNLYTGTGIDQHIFQLHPTTEAELYASRVYMRTKHRLSMSSLSTRHDSGARMSFLSKISLTQISSISVISLPIYCNELWNPQRYRELEMPPFEDVTADEKQISLAILPKPDAQFAGRQKGVPDAFVGHKEERSLRAALKLSLKRRPTAEQLHSASIDRMLLKEARQRRTKVLLLGKSHSYATSAMPVIDSRLVSMLILLEQAPHCQAKVQY